MTCEKQHRKIEQPQEIRYFNFITELFSYTGKILVSVSYSKE